MPPKRVRVAGKGVYAQGVQGVPVTRRAGISRTRDVDALRAYVTGEVANPVGVVSEFRIVHVLTSVNGESLSRSHEVGNIVTAGKGYVR